MSWETNNTDSGWGGGGATTADDAWGAGPATAAGSGWETNGVNGGNDNGDWNTTTTGGNDNGEWNAGPPGDSLGMEDMHIGNDDAVNGGDDRGCFNCGEQG
jgi:hypothetical protein